jgi:hypothetical protein
VMTAGGFVHGYGSFLRFCPVAYPNQPFRSFRLRQNILAPEAERPQQKAPAEKVGIRVRYTQSIEAGEYWPALPTLLKRRKGAGRLLGGPVPGVRGVVLYFPTSQGGRGR